MRLQAAPYPSTEGLGRPIRGPRALAGDWRRFWYLTYNIAVMQWKVRFFGSALGYLWQLVRPLLLFLDEAFDLNVQRVELIQAVQGADRRRRAILSHRANLPRELAVEDE